MTNRTILLVGHGSRLPRAVAEFGELAAALGERLGQAVHACFLELVDPDLATGLADAAREAGDEGEVIVLPLFLGAAGHQKNDVASAIRWAREQFPGVLFRYGAPLGVHARLVELVGLRVQEALQAAGGPESGPTSVVVVGRGSSDPAANAELARLAHLLFEKGAYLSVEYAFQAVAHPTVAEGVCRAQRMGAQQVVVAPFVLFTGRVADDVRAVADQAGAEAGCRVLHAHYLWPHPLLLDVVEQRLREAIDGVAAVNCDLCKYRFAMPGHEDEVGRPQITHHLHGGSHATHEHEEHHTAKSAKGAQREAAASRPSSCTLSAPCGDVVVPHGRVYIVGAGPGDPELVTLKALRLIAAADVILYAGSLVNPAVLEGVRPDACIHDTAGMKLDEQIEVMAKAVRGGRRVVRLHTGDPSIYGATQEQTRELDRLSVPYEIVPGVSSAFAAAAALGIEYTVPEGTQTVIFSRLSARTPVPEREALPLLAAHGSSLVLFLSAGMVERVVDDLRAAGYGDDTQLAVVYRASWPDERVLRGTLGDIAARVRDAEITHHALIVVSPALDVGTDAPARSHLYGRALDEPQRRGTAAIVALTRAGVTTGAALQAALPDAVLYTPAQFAAPTPNRSSTGEVVRYDTSVRQALQSAFQEHAALVCIMAAGIAVRDLAPLVRSKHTDPAVVVVDERGRFAVSLLSGHQGGANELARRVAGILGGTAVVTTASDGQGLPAIDTLGREFGWALGHGEDMTAVIAAMVNGEPLAVMQDAGGDGWLPDPIPANWTRFASREELLGAGPAAALIVTDRLVPPDPTGRAVVYHPRCLAVGVGCNRGTPADEIEAAVLQTLAGAGLEPLSIATLATIEDKAGEPGLLEACRRREWPLRIFTRDEIRGAGRTPNPSPCAERVLGVPGVAEPAARLAAEGGALVVEKRKFANVTVAVARR